MSYIYTSVIGVPRQDHGDVMNLQNHRHRVGKREKIAPDGRTHHLRNTHNIGGNSRPRFGDLFQGENTMSNQKTEAMLPPYFYKITLTYDVVGQQTNVSNNEYLFHNPASAWKCFCECQERWKGEMANPKNRDVTAVHIAEDVYGDISTKIIRIAETTLFQVARVKTLRKTSVQRR